MPIAPHRLGIPAAALAIALVGLAGPLAPTAEARLTTPFRAQVTRTLGPGVVYQRGVAYTNGSVRQSVRVVTIDPTDPRNQVRSLLSNHRVVRRQTVTSTARMYDRPAFRVLAATNGDMSRRGRSDIYAAPNGIHVAGGELMVAQPCANPAIGITPAGKVMAAEARVRIQAWVPDKGQPRWIHRVNAPRVANQTVLYTTRVASYAPTSGGREVVLRMSKDRLLVNDTQKMTVTRVRHGGRTKMQKGYAVLSTAADSKASGWVYDLRVGDTVAIETDFVGDKPQCGSQVPLPGWGQVTEVQTGTHFSLKDGQDWSWASNGDYVAAVHPKTGLGITADGRILMVTVDGRQGSYSTGVSMQEMGQLMRRLGATDAINLDGGGSTSMSTRTKGVIRTDDRPSDGRERPMTQTFAVARVPAPPATPAPTPD